MSTNPAEVACPRCKSVTGCPQWCIDADSTDNAAVNFAAALRAELDALAHSDAISLLMDREEAAWDSVAEVNDMRSGDDARDLDTWARHLDEDSAHELGVAVYGGYVVALEAAVASLEAEHAEAAREPSRSWGSSGWTNEAFPKAVLGP